MPQNNLYTPHVALTLYPPNGRGKNSIHGGICKGAYLLLDGVERNGSLYRTAQELNMAYSKAWTLIQNVQLDFDKELIKTDGARGSVLTPDGKELLDAYRTISNTLRLTT